MRHAPCPPCAAANDLVVAARCVSDSCRLRVGPLRDQISTDSTTTSNNGIPTRRDWISIALTTQTVSHRVSGRTLAEVSRPGQVNSLTADGSRQSVPWAAAARRRAQ